MVSGKPQTITVFERAGFNPMGEMLGHRKIKISNL
jgi:hypothetical protein